MSASDWDEIKRLANDFQRIQLSSSSQKLSERNCIEIVQRLIDLKLLEVIYTTNGKEYLTPVELSKEILEELTVSGGRVNLVDLQQTLNIDLSHIENNVSDLLKHDGSLKLILGQLIDRTYFGHLADDINERLQEQGSLTLSELAKIHNLPGDVLKELIQSKLGKVIKGRSSDDGNDIYTQSYIGRHKAIIRGMFAALTRPSQVFQLIAKGGCQERLFYSLLDELVTEGDLAGSLSGGRPYSVSYSPALYIRSQLDWVDSFFNQNAYLEYDSLTRLGFSDPEAFIKKRYKSKGMHFLTTCCLGALFQERVVSEMEEALSAGEFFNAAPLLPSICSDEDLKAFLASVIKGRTDVTVMADQHVVGGKLVQLSVDSFKELIVRKAEKTVKENPSILVSLEKISLDDKSSRKEEANRRKKYQASKGGSSGGGAGSQAREVKTKNTKKKYLTNQHKMGGEDEDNGEENNDDDDLEGKSGAYTFMTTPDISTHLQLLSQFSDAPQELANALAAHISRTLSNQYNEEMKKVFMHSIHNASLGHSSNSKEDDEEDDADGGGDVNDRPHKQPPPPINKKKMLAKLSENIISHWTSVKVFEKALNFFQEETYNQLSSHLLKSLCSECTSMLVCLFSLDTMSHQTEDYKTITAQDRVKMISLMQDEKTKSSFNKLNSSLNSKTLDEFNGLFETICAKSNISLKKDKKKERLMQFNHRHSLLESLKSSTNPAFSLHLTSVILFNSFTQCILHASGRSVPSIISFLRLHLLPEHYQLMHQCQEAVIKGIKSQSNDEKKEVNRELEEIVHKIKQLPDLVKNYPKNNEEDN